MGSQCICVTLYVNRRTDHPMGSSVPANLSPTVCLRLSFYTCIEALRVIHVHFHALEMH